MHKIHWDDISQLKQGDLLRVRTISEDAYEDSVPPKLSDSEPLAKNIPGQTDWMEVEEGGFNQDIWVVVYDFGEFWVKALDLPAPNVEPGYVYRPDANYEGSTSEKVEVEGISQSRLEPKHNEILSKYDLRGDKNSLLIDTS